MCNCQTSSFAGNPAAFRQSAKGKVFGQFTGADLTEAEKKAIEAEIKASGLTAEQYAAKLKKEAQTEKANRVEAFINSGGLQKASEGLASFGNTLAQLWRLAKGEPPVNTIAPTGADTAGPSSSKLPNIVVIAAVLVVIVVAAYFAFGRK